MIRRPPRSTRMTHSFPTRRSSDLVKAGAQRMAAEAGLILVAPDTSPRGDGVANAPDYDLGQGAGFYVDSTVQPWAKHFRMHSYVTRELPELIAGTFPVKRAAIGI